MLAFFVTLAYIQFFAKEKLDISKEHIEGTIHCKPGAANALLERAYTLLTHREWVTLAMERKKWWLM